MFISFLIFVSDLLRSAFTSSIVEILLRAKFINYSLLEHKILLKLKFVFVDKSYSFPLVSFSKLKNKVISISFLKSVQRIIARTIYHTLYGDKNSYVKCVLCIMQVNFILLNVRIHTACTSYACILY